MENSQVIQNDWIFRRDKGVSLSATSCPDMMDDMDFYLECCNYAFEDLYERSCGVRQLPHEDGAGVQRRAGKCLIHAIARLIPAQLQFACLTTVLRSINTSIIVNDI